MRSSAGGSSRGSGSSFVEDEKGIEGSGAGFRRFASSTACGRRPKHSVFLGGV